MSQAPLDARTRIDKALQRFDPKLKTLRHAFSSIPDCLPYYNDTDSPLEAASELWNELAGAREAARAEAWMKAAFGSSERPVIPERGRRLGHVIEQFGDIIYNIAEENGTGRHLDAVSDWVDALITASRLLVTNKQQKSTSKAPQLPATHSPSVIPKGPTAAAEPVQVFKRHRKEAASQRACTRLTQIETGRRNKYLR
ncbi:hypothetical protein EXIGLDRAFT_767099 [Exidia glandulosa HHB12029]|uniref:Uncharacterized protein n=1 Tax=Exidia glandulosa HHB12029 TaxID=1314781 RepID=A0A165J7X8_EXIGL|nr:hypothetical protein EXIGLDRAFT_767099 [Exidia glandulosa HHB12029]